MIGDIIVGVIGYGLALILTLPLLAIMLVAIVDRPHLMVRARKSFWGAVLMALVALAVAAITRALGA